MTAPARTPAHPAEADWRWKGASPHRRRPGPQERKAGPAAGSPGRGRSGPNRGRPRRSAGRAPVVFDIWGRGSGGQAGDQSGRRHPPRARSRRPAHPRPDTTRPERRSRTCSSPPVHRPAQPRPDEPRPTTRSSRPDTAAPPPRPQPAHPAHLQMTQPPGPPSHPGRHGRHSRHSRHGPPGRRRQHRHDGRSSTRRRAHDRLGPHTPTRPRPAGGGRAHPLTAAVLSRRNAKPDPVEVTRP